MADDQGDGDVSRVPGHFIWTVSFPRRYRIASIRIEQWTRLSHLLRVVGGRIRNAMDSSWRGFRVPARAENRAKGRLTIHMRFNLFEGQASHTGLKWD